MNKKTQIFPEEMYQKISSSILVVLGLIVILMTANTITGKIITNNMPTENTKLLDIIVISWGFLVLITGIWVWFKKI